MACHCLLRRRKAMSAPELLKTNAFFSGQQRRHVVGPDIVSEAAREDAVGIALHHGGHVTPPHREKERDRSGLSDKALFLTDSRGRPAGQLGFADRGIEASPVKIANSIGMPFRLQCVGISLCDRLDEALSLRMANHDQMLHLSFSHCETALGARRIR